MKGNIFNKMKILCGTDIIEISRVKDSIETIGEKFINKIYTQNEIDYCESKGKQKYQHYAVRFAAKEAIFKAISKYLTNKYELSWNEYEVFNDENGRPYVNIINNAVVCKNLQEQQNNFENKKYCKINDFIQNIDISLSHCKEYAIANVVVTVNDN